MEFQQILETIIKVFVGLSILNVWLLNRNNPSQWRGGNATTMKEEFAAYGLSKNVMVVVGILKCVFAVLLLLSIFFGSLELIAVIGIATLMLGAIVMHIKIGDPIKKSLPAAIFLVLSLLVLPL